MPDKLPDEIERLLQAQKNYVEDGDWEQAAEVKYEIFLMLADRYEKRLHEDRAKAHWNTAMNALGAYAYFSAYSRTCRQ